MFIMQYGFLVYLCPQLVHSIREIVSWVSVRETFIEKADTVVALRM